MEEIIDFDEWIKNFAPTEPEYYAIYDIDTGAVTGIYPEHSSREIENRIKIERELAESIFEGKVMMTNCFIDLTSDTLEVIQTHTLRKIDDILHRIINKEFSSITDPDIMITHTVEQGMIKFQISENIMNKKIKWSGDTEMRFLVCSYNDPHKILEIIKFRLDEMTDAIIEYKLITSDINFSLFTTRIFKKYLLERI